MDKQEEPAFPVHPKSHETIDAEYQLLAGMSLRDYFAAKAMQGLIAQSNGSAMGSFLPSGAKWAYEMADAMMQARKESAQ